MDKLVKEIDQFEEQWKKLKDTDNREKLVVLQGEIHKIIDSFGNLRVTDLSIPKEKIFCLFMVMSHVDAAIDALDEAKHCSELPPLEKMSSNREKIDLLVEKVKAPGTMPDEYWLTLREELQIFWNETESEELWSELNKKAHLETVFIICDGIDKRREKEGMK